MNPNELINFLQELKDNIDKEVILLQRAAKISLAFYWIIMIISGVCLAISSILTASNIALITNNSNDAVTLNIIALVAILIGGVANVINSVVGPSTKNSYCCSCFKLYQELSRELEVQMKTYNIDDGKNHAEEYKYLSLFYVSRIQTIQVDQPVIFFTNITNNKLKKNNDEISEDDSV